MSPTSLSLFAEIVPTCAIDLFSSQGVDIFCIDSTALVTALSIPLFRSIGLKPAATDFKPSFTID